MLNINKTTGDSFSASEFNTIINEINAKADTTQLATKADSTALNEYVKATDVANAYQPKGNYLTSTALNGYLTETLASTTYQPKGNYLTAVSWSLVTDKPTLFSGSYTDLTNKPTIPSITGLATEDYVDVTASKLPIDSKITFFGNSLVAHGYVLNNGNPYYMADGFTTQFMMLTGHKLYAPIGANKGVAGERTDQLLARLGESLALNPAITLFNELINDVVQNIPIATIRANRNKIYSAFKSVGTKLYVITPTKTFTYNGGTGLNTAQEAVRLQLRQDAFDLLELGLIDGVVDGDLIITVPTDTTDGVHYTTEADFKVGKAFADLISPILPVHSAGGQIFPASVNNFLLNGGTTYATGWAARYTPAGITVTASKGIDAEGNYQRVVLSGNYTGSGYVTEMYQDFNSTLYKSGDVVEGIVEFSIVTPLNNVSAISPILEISSAGYAQQLAYSVANYPTTGIPQYLPVGKYVIKTPPQVVKDTGVPAIIGTKLQVMYRDTATAQVLSGEIRIHRIGSRKVPKKLELN